MESYLPFRALDSFLVKSSEVNDTDSRSQESTLTDVMALDGSRMLVLKGGFIR